MTTFSVVQTVASLDREYGGTSRVVPQLADALAERGCDVSVVYLETSRSGDAVLPHKAKRLAASAAHVGRHAMWSSNFSRLVAQGLPAAGSRLIHDNGLWGHTNYLAARCAARLQVPFVMSPHGMLEPWALQHRRTRKRIVLNLYLRSILESAAMFVVSAPSEYESVRRAGLKQPIAIVPAGVSLPAATALHAPHVAERRMLFLSRIHPKKGLVPFVEAWRQTPRPGWKVIVAGPDEGGHAAQIQQLIGRSGLASQFEFPGEVEGDAKRRLFESADVFVLPTFSENFGIVVAEALSYSVPVLTTRGAPWEILETLKAGWWVEASMEGIAAGLRAALATTPEQRAAMGRAGRAFVLENLGWGMAGAKTYDAYAWLLGLQSNRPDHVRID